MKPRPKLLQGVINIIALIDLQHDRRSRFARFQGRQSGLKTVINHADWIPGRLCAVQALHNRR